MKFVLSMAYSDPREACELARCGEAAGFDSIAISDHVVHPEVLKTPYPYTADGKPRWDSKAHWPDPWVTIAAMSAVTERIRFLTSIFVLPMRNPFLVAKAVATAQVLSGGRCSLGVGVGWMKDEFDLLEQDFTRRGARCDEMIEVLRTLFGGGMVEHHGRFFDFERLEMNPVPDAPVPILIGGISPPALRRAARLGDGWISDAHTEAELHAYAATLAQLRREAGRSSLPFKMVGAAVYRPDSEGIRRLEDAGYTHLISLPWLRPDAPAPSLEEKRAAVEAFGETTIARFA